MSEQPQQNIMPDEPKPIHEKPTDEVKEAAQELHEFAHKVLWRLRFKIQTYPADTDWIYPLP